MALRTRLSPTVNRCEPASNRALESARSNSVCNPASACGALVSQIGSCIYRTSRRPRPVFDPGRTLVPRFLVAAIKLQDAGTHGEQNQSGQRPGLHLSHDLPAVGLDRALQGAEIS